MAFHPDNAVATLGAAEFVALTTYRRLGAAH